MQLNYEERTKRAYDGKTIVWRRYITYGHYERINGRNTFVPDVYSWFIYNIED